MATPRYEVPAPAVAPRRQIGILQAAQSVLDADSSIGRGIEHIGAPTVVTRFTSNECFAIGQDLADTEKQIDPTPDWLTGDGFTLYQLISCGLMGYKTEEYRTQAQAALEHSEHLGVDIGFAQQYLTTATPVAVGASWDLVLAVGQLEDLARSSDIPGAVIHMNPIAATVGLSCELLEFVGDKLRTKLGTPVNAGVPVSIEPSGQNIADTESWVFLTGAVNFWKAPIFVQDVPDPIHNTNAALTEREYAYTVEGDDTKYAIRVDVPSRLVVTP